MNGKPILIRGGGWAPDMMLRRNSKRLRAEFQYVQDMNLNTIRLEGKIESDEFFKLADEKGILIMAGWCCCDLWEEWDEWKGDQLAVGSASVRSQSLRLRAHPSLLMWLNGSDKPPPADVEQAYLQVLKETSWPNPIVSSASQTPAEQRPFGREDDRALRLRPAKLLADRYEAWRRLRVQHGDKSGTGRADPEFAQKVYPRRSSLADGKGSREQNWPHAHPER